MKYGITKGGAVVTSPTRVDTALNCGIKFYYSEVEGRRSESPSQAKGTRVHGWAELYLTGAVPSVTLTSLADAGRGSPEYLEALRVFVPGIPFLPPPRVAEVEIPFERAYQNGRVRILARPDYRVRAIERPENRPLVGDHKTTKRFRAEKDALYLASNTQLIFYGHGLFPDAEQIDLEHVDYKTEGPPAARKVTSKLFKGWLANRVETLTQFIDTQVRFLYKQTTPPIEFGKASECWAYGGCEHRAYCPFYQRNQKEKK